MVAFVQLDDNIVVVTTKFGVETYRLSESAARNLQKYLDSIEPGNFSAFPDQPKKRKKR